MVDNEIQSLLGSHVKYGTHNGDLEDVTTEVESYPTPSNESSCCNGEGDSHKATIGYWGGMAIAVNSIIGPAMLDLPSLYQKSGFIPTTFCVLVVCLLMCLCCLHMTNVISKLPGNSNFKREIEYSEAFRIYGGQNWLVFTQISYFCCMMCQIVASIVDTAQVVDQFIAKKSTYGTFALSFHNYSMSAVGWDGSSCPIVHDKFEPEAYCDPFEADEYGYVISIGYVITLVCFLPLGLLNLKENVAWQIFCFIVTLGTILQFTIYFFSFDHDIRNLSMWGESWYTLFGIILFDFTLVTAIPAWLYEKSPDVSASKVIITSTVATSLVYIILGSLGALAMPHVSQNMLSSMIAGSYGSYMQLGASVFAFVIIGLGIPLFSVLMRLNLTGSGLCSVQKANILAVYLPWAISWLFYNGARVEQLLSWGGMLFTSICAFLAPTILALKATYKSNEKGSVPAWFGIELSVRGDKIALYLLVIMSTVLVLVSICGQLIF